MRMSPSTRDAENDAVASAAIHAASHRDRLECIIVDATARATCGDVIGVDAHASAVCGDRRTRECAVAHSSRVSVVLPMRAMRRVWSNVSRGDA